MTDNYLTDKMMTIRTLLLTVSLTLAASVSAQQDGVDSNFRGCDYTEPDDNSTANASKWNALNDKLYMTWASRDKHYKKREVPDVTQSTDMEVCVWRGERAGVEALLYSKNATAKLALKADVGSTDIICEPRFMNYVLTDEKQGCGTNDKNTTTYLVPDIIDIETTKAIEARTVRPVWVTLEIPRDIDAGSYDVAVNVVNATDNSVAGTLNLKVTVCDRTLPKPEEQKFFLNFWQQPYAISRYYGVENWSQQHLDILRPYLKMMARAGQKAVSAILFYEPWGDQSNDKFEAMIRTVKKNDGTYTYDYTVFDKWVELNEECGITDEIHCFSMIPWDMTFVYYDENGNKHQTSKMQTGTTEYNNFWTAFLTAFASHLREKGWFDKTLMALDERSSGDVVNVYNLMKALPSESQFKLSLAGAYQSNLVDKIYDYCLELPAHSFSSSELASRQAKGFRSTVYTCCSAIDPNIITNNNPADGAYLPVHAISGGYDGYLHWSWSNWTDNPLKDCRFKYWGGGDTYLIYPGNRSGVRFERVIEGVQLAEKVRILREAYTSSGDTKLLETLNNMVAKFQSGLVSSSVTSSTSSAGLVAALQKIVNTVSGNEGGGDDITEYCQVELASEQKDVAIAKRWLTTVTTSGAADDMSYSASSASENGYVLCEDRVNVYPGSSFRLHMVATTNDDDLQYCRLAVFADWDGDKIFATTEKIHTFGTQSTGTSGLLDHTITITVPSDAATGLTRIRLCYADAWGDEPDACGPLLKGFAFDIPVYVIDNKIYYLDEENTEVGHLKNQQDRTGRQLLLRRNLKAGQWGSLILPFSLEADAVRAAFGKDVILSRLDNVNLSNGYNITFKKVDLSTASPALEAGLPYIIKPGKDMVTLADGNHTYIRIDKSQSTGFTEENIYISGGKPVIIEFPNVVLSNLDIDETGMKVQDVGGVSFRGTYIRKTEEGLMPKGSFVLGGNDGRWYHTTSAINTVGGFRSWIDTSNIPLGSKITFSLDGVEDGDVTGIGIIGCEGVPERQSIYSLDGRKMREGQNLNGLAKGIYLINGKKKVIIR